MNLKCFRYEKLETTIPVFLSQRGEPRFLLPTRYGVRYREPSPQSRRHGPRRGARAEIGDATGQTADERRDRTSES
jgi:hypothetical protein